MSSDLRNLDVEQIMQDIRERIRYRQDTPQLTPLGPLLDMSLNDDLAALGTSSDVYHVQFPPARTLLGPLITLARKVVRRLMIPSLARQVSYNTASTRILERLTEQCDLMTREFKQLAVTQDGMNVALEALHADLRAIDGQRQAHEELLSAHGKTFDGVRLELDALRRRQEDWRADIVASQGEMLRPLREQAARAERRLRRLIQTLDGGEREAAPPPATPSVPGECLAPEFDYAGFEERFRGGEEDVRNRQRAYLEYFRGVEDVLDIACGRGEFLELLREGGIGARGVDLDSDMVLACREKGLDVTRGDVFSLLRSLPDGSLGGVFSAQFIEHLEPLRVIELVSLCHRKLRPGGRLVLETVNPRCLLVFAESIYMDFSHVRPIHPAALSYLLESMGFDHTEVRETSPVDPGMRVPEVPELGEPFNRGLRRLNDLLYGYQDYAVVGRKAYAGPMS